MQINDCTENDTSVIASIHFKRKDVSLINIPNKETGSIFNSNFSCPIFNLRFLLSLDYKASSTFPIDTLELVSIKSALAV